MDLGRAKTILIIAFLLLNGILLYQIYSKQQVDTQYTVLIQEEIAEVEELLRSQEIYLNIPIPTDIRERPFLRVNKVTHTTTEIRAGLEVDNEQIIIAIGEDNQIGYAWINKEVIQESAYDISAGSADFPASYLLEGKSYRPYLDFVEQGTGSIVYLQYHNEYPLFGTTATANVENYKIGNWRQIVLTNIEAEDIARPILTAATALRRLPNEMEADPVTIEKIELGYYSRFTEAESWLLPPVWGVTLSTGEEFYINAFTGELEGLQEHAE